MTDAEQKHPIPELDRSGLRHFGLVTGAAFAVLFGLLLPWLIGRQFPLWPWVVFAVLGLAGLLTPELLRPVHYWWMRLALAISKVTTPIVLGVVFFLVITPFGLVMKLFGKDPMQRKMHEKIETYRVKSRESGRENLERPY